jgi:hypothetical protein
MTVYLAVHKDNKAFDILIDLLEKIHLDAYYVTEHEDDFPASLLSTPCLLRFIDEPFLSQIDDATLKRLDKRADDSVTIVFGKRKEGADEHHNYYYIGDEPTDKMKELFLTSIR